MASGKLVLFRFSCYRPDYVSIVLIECPTQVTCPGNAFGVEVRTQRLSLFFCSSVFPHLVHLATPQVIMAMGESSLGEGSLVTMGSYSTLPSGSCRNIIQWVQFSFTPELQQLAQTVHEHPLTGACDVISGHPSCNSQWWNHPDRGSDLVRT